MVRQAAFTLLASIGIVAQAATPTEAPVTWANRLWDHATLYEGTDAGFFQKVRFMGRYHTNYAWVGDDASDWDLRRARLGFNLDFLDQFEFRNEWNVAGLDDEDFEPRFSNIDTLFLTWKASPTFQITAGKHKLPFTQEFRMSSNDMPTIERTVLTQSLVRLERTWGLSGRGEIGPWSYATGLHFTTLSGDYNESFDLGGTRYGLASVGYDFGHKDHTWQKALVTAQYAYTDKPSKLGPQYSHTASLSFEGSSGKFELATDALLAWSQSTVGGFLVTPSYFVTKDVQVVARYSWASGDPDTLALRDRYEALSTTGSGDECHSIYAGINYFVHGHRLKLKVGAEYLRMTDSLHNGGAYAGVTALTGLVFWF